MNSGILKKLTVEYKDIFVDTPRTVEEYLDGISRNLLLEISSFFLAFYNKNSKYEEVESLVELFFGDENWRIANQIFQRLNEFAEETGASLVIINKQSSLKLFEYCFDNSKEIDIQSRAEAEINVFKAYLLLNQINSEKDNVAGDTTKELGETRLACLYIAQTYPYTDLENYNLIEVTICQFIKIIFLFEFLESHERTQIHLNTLLSEYECSTWKEYVKKLSSLTISVHNAESESHLDITVTQDEYYIENCAFLEKLILSEDEITTDVDFRKIRSNPMYKVADGVYRIIFNLFVIEKMYKGLYFKLNEINSSLPSAQKISNFRSFYTDEFSEQYLLYRILQDIYQGKYIEFTGREILACGIDSEPDYYIRNGNKVFLFESKDIFINASVKTSANFNLIEEEFRKKLYHDGTKKKAVQQLIKNIERVLKQEIPFDTKYKEGTVYIYPILVMHDRQFNLAGLNQLINSWFSKELSKLQHARLNTARVRPITIIDIDTFILYQDILRNRKIKLDEVIDKYLEFISLTKKKNYKSQEHFYATIESTLIPFSVFLSNYLADKKIYTVPKMLREKGFKLFDR